MSTSRRITRLAAATALGVVLAGTVAAPAFAADVIGVSLSGVPSNFTAGGRADGFTVGLRNNSNANVAAVTVSFTVSLNGLTADEVRIRVGGADLPVRESGPGQIVAADPRSHDFLPRIGRTEIGYSIEFMSGTPSGRATLTASAIKQTSVLGTSSDTITIKGGATAASPSPTAAVPTDPATQGSGVGINPSPVPTGALADNNQISADDGSGGIPIGLYIMGAILVGVGGAILWLLFKQRPQAVPAGGDVPPGEHDQPTLGYPAGRAPAAPLAPSNLAPTAQLPALRGSSPAGPPPGGPGRGQPPILPPVDPWATQGGPRPPRHNAD